MNRWETAKHLFDKAVAMPKAEQTLFLRDACNQNDDLYQTVFSMLEADDKSAQFSVSQVISEQASALIENVDDVPNGTQIGSFSIIHKLADGGMGSVYHGCRADDMYEQEVAIKLLTTKISSPEAIQRFKQERQILANLNHPNIAHLLDGGTTQSGVPYIVMEYINGTSILQYVAERKLSLDQLCDLFLQVCDAVDYAHRNLVIHRDIKAENILVTDNGQASLLDFGIASIDEDSLISDEKPKSGAMTPYSASPEQIMGDIVSTGSDIYSMGVVFYHMLGATNIYGKHFTELGELKDAIKQIIPKPISETSTRENIRSKLKGDMDAILAKALEKDTQRRYASAAAFAEDIRCFLRKMPVSARQQTPIYIIQKLAQRFPKTTGVSVVVLLVFLTTVTIYTSAINHARDVAEQRLNTAERVSDFLVDVFSVSEPTESLGNKITARQILDQGSLQIASTLKDEPEIRYELIHTLGRVYLSLGIQSRAEQLFDEELNYLTNSPTVTRKHIRNILAFATLRDMQGRMEEQASLIADALEKQKTLTGDESLEVANIAMRMVMVLVNLGDQSQALQIHEKYIDIQRQFLPEESPEIIASRTLGNLLQYEAGNYDAAAAGAAELHPVIQTTFGDIHPKIADNLGDWGYYLEQTGDLEQSRDLLLNALEIDTQIFGENHPVVMADLADLGSLMGFIDTEEALSYLQRVIDIGPASMAEIHPLVALAHNDIAGIYLRKRMLDKAENHYLESLRINREVYGEVHPEVATNLSNLGVTYMRNNKLDDAKRALFDSLALRQELMGDNHPHIAASLSVIGSYYFRTEDYAQSLDFYKQSLIMKRNSYDDSSESILTARARVARSALAMGDVSSAGQELNAISKDIGQSDFIFDSSQAYLAQTYATYIEQFETCSDRQAKLNESVNTLQSYPDFQTSHIGKLSSLIEACE